ncbi:tRNA-splicing endonuclease subunit Sen34 [Microplitis mediator]|uniref:tRNA-splicing endonuclease subunit Sen34 n=1 Tax=Microplitis mediator TaxID=375433 RepID=UPI0025555162|nr:tRNA-splicing endonuclease subunit Sen34 [Microplitis mediator]
MIDLILSNGNVFVWSAEDWLTLRRQHRIIGATIGCTPTLPRQEVLHGLPLMLIPEEVTLLLETKIARLIEYPCLRQEPDDDLKKVFEDHRKRLFAEQDECLKEGKRLQILGKIESIVEGKRRKILGLKTSKKNMRKSLDGSTAEAASKIEIDRDALLAEELDKLPKLDPDDSLVQIHTNYPWKNDDVKEVPWNYPQSDEEKLRCQVYKDLWSKGYFLTSGEKFGGDYLAYPGDPLMFHSQFIILCTNIDEEIPILDLSGQCRVACHVRKTQVYAYFSDDNQVTYQSFQYENSSMI